MDSDVLEADWVGHHGERQIATIGSFGHTAHLSLYAHAAKVLPGPLFVDVGCGSGYGVEYAMEHGFARAHGLERESRIVEELRTRFKRPQFSVCDLNSGRLPFADASIGSLFCSNVLEHIAYPDRAVTAIARALGADGTAMLAVPPISTVGELRENARNLFHITNLPQWTWRTKFERWFHEVVPLRHWFAHPERMPLEVKRLCGLAAEDEPGSYGLEDFTVGPFPEAGASATITAVFLCSRPRSAPLPPDHEQPTPAEWDAVQIEAEARQASFADAQEQLRSVETYWRGEVHALHRWLLESRSAAVDADFILDAVSGRLALYR